jgi:Ca2+-binding EF-hand superfamily protein
MRHPLLISSIKSFGEHLLIGSNRWDLQNAFRMNDNSNSGSCSRDDFINAVFDNARGLKPSDLMKLLSTFADEYEELVSYDDFIRLVDRQG